jgi:hypothetical protein
MKHGAPNSKHTTVSKRTSQGGKPKTSTMNKSQKASFKINRGQGRGR